MEALRNLVVWLLMAAGMAGCREMKWPVEPESGEIVIRTITTDVQRGGAFSIEGQNLGRLAGNGWVVFYDHQNIRLPMRLVIGNTLFGCVLPDSVCSGRVMVVDGRGNTVVDTALYVYGDSLAVYEQPLPLEPLPGSVVWNQRLPDMMERCRFVDVNGTRHDALPDPRSPSTYVVPPIHGAFSWIVYDAKEKLYHRTNRNVVVKRPEVEILTLGTRPAASVKYVGERLEDWHIRLRSKDGEFIRPVIRIDERMYYPVVLLDGIPSGSYDVDVIAKNYERTLEQKLNINETASTPLMADMTIQLSMPVQIVASEWAMDEDGASREIRRYLKDTIVTIDESFQWVVYRRTTDTIVFSRANGFSTSWEPGGGGIILNGDRSSFTIQMKRFSGYEGSHVQVMLRNRPYTLSADGRMVFAVQGDDLFASREIEYWCQRFFGAGVGMDRIVEKAVACAEPALLRVELTLDI